MHIETSVKTADSGRYRWSVSLNGVEKSHGETTSYATAFLVVSQAIKRIFDEATLADLHSQSQLAAKGPAVITEDMCPVTKGLHEPDWTQLHVEGDGDGEYLDTVCKHCSRPGSLGALSALTKNAGW